MRILFILNSLCFGGAERQAINLINRLDKHKFDIGLVYLDRGEDLLPQIDVSDLIICRCLDRSGKFDPRSLMGIMRIIRQYHFDAVFCINEYPFLYAWFCNQLIGRKYKFRLMTAIHYTFILPGFWQFVKKEMYRRLLNRSDDLVFVCRNQLRYWEKEHHIDSSKSTVIYNGIDEAQFTDDILQQEKLRLRRELGFSEDSFIAGICAALRVEKNHHDFLDAIKKALDRGFDVKGLIIGDGDRRSEIEKCIQANQLADKIKITGFKEDVRPYIGICDCMVLTSHHETLSIAALESMSMSKPMIMPRLIGAEEMIEHGVSGYLFEKGDVKTLSEYLIGLHQKRNSEKMGREARNRVIQCFSLDKMTDDYENLFSRRITRRI